MASVLIGNIVSLLRGIIVNANVVLLGDALGVSSIVESVIEWIRIWNIALFGRGACSIHHFILATSLSPRRVVYMFVVVLACYIEGWVSVLHHIRLGGEIVLCFRHVEGLEASQSLTARHATKLKQETRVRRASTEAACTP